MVTELLLEIEYIGDSKIRQGDKKVGGPNNHKQYLQMHKNLGAFSAKSPVSSVNVPEGSVSS